MPKRSFAHSSALHVSPPRSPAHRSPARLAHRSPAQPCSLVRLSTRKGHPHARPPSRSLVRAPARKRSPARACPPAQQERQHDFAKCRETRLVLLDHLNLFLRWLPLGKLRQGGLLPIKLHYLTKRYHTVQRGAENLQLRCHQRVCNVDSPSARFAIQLRIYDGASVGVSICLQSLELNIVT